MSKDEGASKDRADNGGGAGKARDREVQVHFRHIAEAEKVEFKIAETASLQAAWDRAYVELKVAHNAQDVLQTADNPPKSLMASLSVSLADAKERKLVKNYHFEIAAATGGA